MLQVGRPSILLLLVLYAAIPTHGAVNQIPGTPYWGLPGRLLRSKLPPRARVSPRVTADISASIIEVVATLGRQADLDWMVGLPPAPETATSQIAIHDQPLWQALDMLRETHDYDWGHRRGMLILWPTMRPRTPRAQPGEDAPPAPHSRSAGEPVVLHPPVPLEQAIQRLADAHMLGDRTIYTEPELKAWRLAARITTKDPATVLPAIAAAVAGQYDTMGPYRNLRVSCFARLDAALDLAQQSSSHAAELSPDALHEKLRRLEAQIRDDIIGRFRARDWDALLCGGILRVPLRELSNEAAAAFVAAARLAAQRSPEPVTIDWAKPYKMRARIHWGPFGPPPGSDTPARSSPRPARPHLTYSVPLTDGTNLGF